VFKALETIAYLASHSRENRVLLLAHKEGIKSRLKDLTETHPSEDVASLAGHLLKVAPPRRSCHFPAWHSRFTRLAPPQVLQEALPPPTDSTPSRPAPRPDAAAPPAEDRAQPGAAQRAPREESPEEGRGARERERESERERERAGEAQREAARRPPPKPTRTYMFSVAGIEGAQGKERLERAIIRTRGVISVALDQDAMGDAGIMRILAQRQLTVRAVVRAQVDTPRPSPRTNRTRRAPHPVLIGHAASLSAGQTPSSPRASARVRPAAPASAASRPACLSLSRRLSPPTRPATRAEPAGAPRRRRVQHLDL
jgi:hypothetical protein